jgi:hypothetical protein
MLLITFLIVFLTTPIFGLNLLDLSQSVIRHDGSTYVYFVQKSLRNH